MIFLFLVKLWILRMITAWIFLSGSPEGEVLAIFAPPGPGSGGDVLIHLMVTVQNQPGAAHDLHHWSVMYCWSEIKLVGLTHDDCFHLKAVWLCEDPRGVHDGQLVLEAAGGWPACAGLTREQPGIQGTEITQAEDTGGQSWWLLPRETSLLLFSLSLLSVDIKRLFFTSDLFLYCFQFKRIVVLGPGPFHRLSERWVHWCAAWNVQGAPCGCIQHHCLSDYLWFSEYSNCQWAFCLVNITFEQTLVGSCILQFSIGYGQVSLAFSFY